VRLIRIDESLLSESRIAEAEGRAEGPHAGVCRVTFRMQAGCLRYKGASRPGFQLLIFVF
jgi:hypothetical protein